MNVMKRKIGLLCMTVMLSAWAALAAVAPGQNLLINGELDAEQMDFPPFWTATNREVATYEPTVGPESTGAVILKAPAGEKASVSVRQQGLKLVAGETYKISAWVKTNAFSSGHYGVILHNSGWFSSQGLREWPAFPGRIPLQI